MIDLELRTIRGKGDSSGRAPMMQALAFVNQKYKW